MTGIAIRRPLPRTALPILLRPASPASGAPVGTIRT